MTTREDISATLIRRVRVLDGAAVSSRTSVLIEGAQIVAVDPDLSSTGRHAVDGRDSMLLPGFIDAHVHLHGRDNLVQLAGAGITTALDMACWPPELVDELRHNRGLTDIRSAGYPGYGRRFDPQQDAGQVPRADLVLIAGNPAADITDSRRVERV